MLRKKMFALIKCKKLVCLSWESEKSLITKENHSSRYPTSIKYKLERDKRYLPYIVLGRWLCSISAMLKVPE